VFASTLRENLRLARPGCRDEAVVAALVEAGLGHWLAGLPDGLDTVLGTGGRGMSGGERARLGIARALLSGRPVLLLDEPVAHLDHATAVSVLGDLVDATRGRTVVMVTHRPDGLEGFDRVLDLGAKAATARVGS
jgi:ABC-type transport system involved in cytochrome bd biosynthesis fused ATPase/permease subunit